MKIWTAILLFVGTVWCQNSQFMAFKSRMDGKVKKLAEAMTDVYGRRCGDSVVSCETKSYNLCEGTSVKRCFDDFPKAGECLDGGALMSEETTIRFPNDRDPFNLDDEERQFVCVSALMDPDFKDLDQDRNFEYGMAYMGTSLGSFRSYPSSRQINWEETKQCNDYDPRFRPWYVAATSGSKNIILIIDVSGSMQGTKIEIARQAASSVVSTMSNNDFVGVITFESSSKSLVETEIKRATSEMKDSLKEKIGQIEASGGTNYINAFRKGFDMLARARADEFGSPCVNTKNLFLFLTDGKPTEGIQNTSEIVQFIHDQMEENNIEDIILFTYALGEADTNVLQEMSCEFNGIMFEIESIATQSQLATIMKNYYSYIAGGISIQEPIWTEPYEDAFGFGQMVTVSMPVYFEENNTRVILGAVGIDVIMKTLTDFGLSQDDAVKLLIEDAPCLDQALDACEIEELRPTESSKCGLTNCSVSRIQVCDEYPINDLYVEVEDTGERKCCSLMIGELVGILIGAVVVLGCLIFIICACIRRNQRQDVNRDEERAAGKDPYPPAYPPTYFNNNKIPSAKQLYQN